MKRKIIAAAALASMVIALCAGCQSAPFGLSDAANLAQELQNEMEREASRLQQEAEAAASQAAASQAALSSASSSDTASTAPESGSSASSAVTSSEAPASTGSDDASSGKNAGGSEAKTSVAVNSAQSGYYMLKDSDSRYVSKSELQSMSDYELMIARNEIYARHGRRFVDTTIQLYFDQQSWYHGTVAPEAFSDSVFNQYERANLETIVSVERSRK